MTDLGIKKNKFLTCILDLKHSKSKYPCWGGEEEGEKEEEEKEEGGSCDAVGGREAVGEREVTRDGG